MSRVLPLVVLLTFVGCGKSPTSPSQQPPPTPPPPSYATMTGSWSGQAVIVAQAGNQSASNTCTMAWQVASQTAGSFSGSYQLSGGTASNCASAGTITGTVGLDNAVSVTFSQQVGGTNQCQKTAGGTAYAGSLANGVVTVALTESFLCPGNVAASRQATITVRRLGS